MSQGRTSYPPHRHGESAKCALQGAQPTRVAAQRYPARAVFRPLASLSWLPPVLLLPASLCAQAEWTQVPLFAARSGHAVAAAATGSSLLVFGGSTGSQLLGDTWTWSGSQWQRLAVVGTAAVPAARTEHVLVHDPVRAQFVLFGGRGANGDLGDTWVHANGQWTRVVPAASPQARSGHAAAFHPASGRVVVFGGRFNQQLRDDTWTWDGAAWTQQVASVRPAARSHAALAQAQGSSALVLFGGSGATGDLGDTWEWSASTWTSRSPAAAPPARARAVLVAAAAPAAVLLAGGESASGLRGDAWQWDGTAWTASPVHDLPVATAGAAATVDGGGAVRLVGGRTATGPTSVLRGHTGTAWSELAGESAPPARLDAASAWDPVRGEWLVFGGEALDGSLLQDLWRWDGTRWARATTAAGPQARRGSVLAHDPVSGAMILFGGYGLTALNSLPVALADTWRWDGIAWSQLSPTATPPARGHAAACAMPGAASPGVLLVGGADTALVSMGDAWRWDGSNWVQQALPPLRARHGHGMALDTTRAEVVLFGGRSALGIEADTWSFDGSQWVQRATTGTRPPGRQFHGLAFDAFRGRVLVHAGLDGNFQPLADSWEWDGATWRTVASLASIPVRHGGAMGNDAVRRRSVWFGGTATGAPVAETWSFASPNPPSVTAFGSGCLGSNGIPQAGPVATRMPWITGTLGVRLTNLPTAPGLFVFFFGSYRDTWQGNPLPFDLGGYGLPGCSALVRPQEFLFVGHQGSTHDWSTPVVSDPRLVGTNVFLQGLSLDAGAPNGIGAVSNGVWAVLGLY